MKVRQIDRWFSWPLTLGALILAFAVFGVNDPKPAQAAGPGTWTQAQVNAAVQAGVAYIDTQYNPVPGNYGTVYPTAETGMDLVAYSVLANGSFSNLTPAYQAHVQGAIAWLLTQQDAAGWWGPYETYETGIVLAGLSSFTTVNGGVPAAIAKGRAFLIGEFQTPPHVNCSSADGSPTASYCGGWNYEDVNFPFLRSDESNTGYAMFGLQLTGGVPATIVPDNINWQHHIQEISTNSFFGPVRNDGGGDYQPGIHSGSTSSNANNTGSMLFGLGYDGVVKSDPHVLAGLTFGQDVLDEYELSLPSRNMAYHDGANEDGTCSIGLGCDWHFSGASEGGYHYSLFSLTKGLGAYIAPSLNTAINWYAKVVDLLLGEQLVNGSWPQDGRDDGTILIATAFAVGSLGLVGTLPVPPCAPPPAGMAAWWRLDEAKGDATVFDSTFHGHDSSVWPGRYNANMFGPGMVRGAFDFFQTDGTMFVQVPSGSALEPGGGDFSIDAWVYPVTPDDPNAIQPIVDKWDPPPPVGPSQGGYAFYIQNGVLMFQYRDTVGGTGTASSIATLPYDQWSHVAVTIKRFGGVPGPATVQPYINGLPDGGISLLSVGAITNGQDLLIGGTRLPDGLAKIALDEVEIFDRVVSQVDIQAIYNALSSGKCPIVPSVGGVAALTVSSSGSPFPAVPLAAGAAAALAVLTVGGWYARRRWLR